MNEAVFVVIPAYNEERVIRSTVAPLLAVGYSVVVVDDGSSDDTWRVLQELPVHAVRHPTNLGQGAALQTGVAYALRNEAEFVVHFDADGQHQAHEIEELLRPLRNGLADVALGSRFLRPEDISAVPLPRRILLRIAVLANRLLTGLWLTDAHNGFRALNRAAAEKITLRENGFAHASEILMRIRAAELRYQEVPTRIVYSEYSIAKGQSSLNALNILVDLISSKVVR